MAKWKEDAGSSVRQSGMISAASSTASAIDRHEKLGRFIMTRYVIRLALTATAFYVLFPLIPGVQFHGNFLYALLAGALFALFGWIVEFGAMALSAVLAVSTLGFGLFILVPAWLLGFWLLPAVALRLVADLMPNTLAFSGLAPAIVGGLIMLLIGVVTSGDVHAKVGRFGNRIAAP